MAELLKFDLNTEEGRSSFFKAIEAFNKQSAEWSEKKRGLRGFLDRELKRLEDEGRQGDIVIVARTSEGSYVSNTYCEGDSEIHRTNYDWCEGHGSDMVASRIVGLKCRVEER